MILGNNHLRFEKYIKSLLEVPRPGEVITLPALPQRSGVVPTRHKLERYYFLIS